MIDAAANDALDALAACPCCLLGPQQRSLKTPYTHLNNTEIYWDMLKECFNIQLDVASDKCGICEECVASLRGASQFKRQVQRSQRELQERLARALKIIEETPPVVVKSEIDDTDGWSDNLLGEELPDETADSGGVRERAATLPWAGTVSAGARAQLAMSCSVRLERLRGDEAPHKCRICLRTFPRESSLATHMKETHEHSFGLRVGEEANTCDTIHTGQKPYTCDICNKGFTFKSSLQRHVKIHSGLKPYHCDVCNKAFLLKHDLNSHVRIHARLKPCRCDICNNQFTDKSYLKIHARIHTGQKLYSCGICNKQFAHNTTLQRHVRIHTGQKPYSCDICNKEFTQKTTLQNHVRIHTGQRPYSCDICNKQFTRKGTLQEHVGIHTR